MNLLHRFISFAARRRPTVPPVTVESSRASAAGATTARVAPAITAPEIVNFCGTPMVRLPTGPAAATMMQASQVLHHLPRRHPDRLEMEVRLRRLAGDAETFDQWMRAAAILERAMPGIGGKP